MITSSEVSNIDSERLQQSVTAGIKVQRTTDLYATTSYNTKVPYTPGKGHRLLHGCEVGMKLGSSDVKQAPLTATN